MSFEWKDYANGNKTKIMTLDAGGVQSAAFCSTSCPRGFVRNRQLAFWPTGRGERNSRSAAALLGAPSAPRNAAIVNREGEMEERRPKPLPRLQERAYDSDPDSSRPRARFQRRISTRHEYSLARCRTNSRFAQAKGDLCPDAPILAENITFHPRGPPSAIKIRRLRLAFS